MSAIVRSRADIAKALGKLTGPASGVVSKLVTDALERANSEAFEQMYGDVLRKMDAIVSSIDAVGQSGEQALAAVLEQVKAAAGEDGGEERKEMQAALDRISREIAKEPKYVQAFKKAVLDSVDERMADLVQALTELRRELAARERGEKEPEKWRMEVQRDQTGRIVDAVFTSI